MSRVSKGKLKHLWSLYDVWNIISFRASTIWYFEPDPAFKAAVDKWLLRMEDPKVIDRVTQFKKRMEEHRASPYLYEREGKGYYGGCRKLNNELDVEMFISITTLTDPVHLTYYRNKRKPNDRVIGYDLESGYYSVPCGGFNHQHNASGIVYAEGSLDRMKHLDIANTYPKTIEVVDDTTFWHHFEKMAAPGA